jgi:hypothetical protein
MGGPGIWALPPQKEGMVMENSITIPVEQTKVNSPAR